MQRQINAGLLFLLIIIGGCCQAVAAPQAHYWEKWDKNNSNNTQIINYQPWQNFLNHYLIQDKKLGMWLVAYDKVTPKDKAKLQDYIHYLAHLIPTTYSKPAQEAYWINLYNALTVNLILQHYPVSSITKLGKGWFRFGPWDDKIIQIEGSDLTLNDIEHRILRPLWKDPRLHYALNCASLSCPDLSDKVFTAKNMNMLLNQLAKRYINQPKGVWFHKGKLRLSSIYEWYQSDFGDQKSLFKHLETYASPPLATQLKTFKGKPSYAYDWKLNKIK